MNTKALAKIIAASAVTLAAGFSTVAAAAPYGETLVSTSAAGMRTATVSLADLDLNSVAGQENLTYRLQRAARMVCGSEDLKLIGSLRQAIENKNCQSRAVGRAMGEISNTSLAVAVSR